GDCGRVHLQEAWLPLHQRGTRRGGCRDGGVRAGALGAGELAMTTVGVEEAAQLLAEQLRVTWRDDQIECFKTWESLDRMCVYYPTGKGKTKTMLAAMALKGFKELVVIAPPVTERNEKK